MVVVVNVVMNPIHSIFGVMGAKNSAGNAEVLDVGVLEEFLSRRAEFGDCGDNTPSVEAEERGEDAVR